MPFNFCATKGNFAVKVIRRQIVEKNLFFNNINQIDFNNFKLNKNN